MDSWHSQRITSKILAAVPHLNDIDKTSIFPVFLWLFTTTYWNSIISSCFYRTDEPFFLASFLARSVADFVQINFQPTKCWNVKANQKRTHFAYWLTVFWKTLRFDGLACGVRTWSVHFSGTETTLIPKTQYSSNHTSIVHSKLTGSTR